MFHVMLLAIRAMTYICDVVPISLQFLINQHPVRVLCAKLGAIEYLDVAEQCVQVLEKISYYHPQACLEDGAVMAVLSYIDFFSLNIQFQWSLEYEVYGENEFTFRNKMADHLEGSTLSKLGSSSTAELHPKSDQHGRISTSMPPANVMTRLILIMVWRKLIRNPNTYSSLIGLAWSLVSYRWAVQMPVIVAHSISILSEAGLGMAMFSLGLFMALQPRIIACGHTVASFAMAIRFLVGLAVMAAASAAVGLRGVLLHVAIVRAALPQGIVPFVFAKEYNVHPDILSTGHIYITINIY